MTTEGHQITMPNLPGRVDGAMTYEPLTSVWTGSDSELLDKMLDFHSAIEPDPILDATYNTGRIWGDSNRPIVSMDIDPRFEPDIIADNREMPGVPDEEFAVVVYDPPHVGPQGRDKSSKRFAWTLVQQWSAARNRAGL